MKTTERNPVFLTKYEYELIQKSTHLFLNQNYYNLLFCQEEKKAINEVTLNKLKHLESVWINREKKLCNEKYDLQKRLRKTSSIVNLLKKHPACQHKLFDYLCLKADKEDLQLFIAYDAVLNLEFFDYLALSMVGTSDGVKRELMTMLWHEIGQEDAEKSHKKLFQEFISELGIQYHREEIIINMPWQGVARINLFNYLVLYPYHKIKYIGLLAATELLNQFHYHQLIKSIERLFPKASYTFYKNQTLLNGHEKNVWLDKVIFPEIYNKPKETADFWLGFYLRLESIQHYYDKLLSLLMHKNFSKHSEKMSL